MSLSDLIKAVGDDNVQFQVLRESLVNVSDGKRQARVTFFTDRTKAQQLMWEFIAPDKRPDMVGLIVWLPRDKMPSEYQKL